MNINGKQRQCIKNRGRKLGHSIAKLNFAGTEMAEAISRRIIVPYTSPGME